MPRRRRRRPGGKLARIAAVGVVLTFGINAMMVSCLTLGGQYTSSAGASPCTIPEIVGGPGVQILSDRALQGLGGTLPTQLAGGAVSDTAKAGRTAQQAVTDIGELPDTAPGTFVVSLEQDDAGETGSFKERINELTLLLGGRTVYWVSTPGKEALTSIVRSETLGIEGGGWQIIDMAAAVKDHANWWDTNHFTDKGLSELAHTLTARLQPAPTAAPTGTPAPGSPGPTGPVIRIVSSVTGEAFDLNDERRGNAQAVLAAGAAMGVPPKALVIAIATVLQESRLINLDHGDRDSVGLFQQRPSQGWGTVAQLMDPAYASRKFYEALLRVPGWQQMSVNDAAQAVQISGLPWAYAQWEQSATTIASTLQGVALPGCGTAPSGSWVAPIAAGTYNVSSEFGLRFGGTEFHGGMDLAAPLGTPIVAIGAGTVAAAGPAQGFGWWVVIDHGGGWFSVYGHMRILEAAVGQKVLPGQRIAYVGSEGQSTGPHLHLEIRQGGIEGEKHDPRPWMAQRGVNL